MPDHLPEPEQVERTRFEERLLDSGACSCIWDANPDDDGPDDIIVKPDPECLAHGVLSALQSQRQLTEKAEARLEEAETRGCGCRFDETGSYLQHTCQFHRAHSRKAELEETERERQSAEHRAESLQRQVSEYREGLEEIVNHGSSYHAIEDLVAIARSALTSSSTPEQGND